jgi:hypothetical protein
MKIQLINFVRSIERNLYSTLIYVQVEYRNKGPSYSHCDCLTYI